MYLSSTLHSIIQTEQPLHKYSKLKGKNLLSVILSTYNYQNSWVQISLLNRYQWWTKVSLEIFIFSEDITQMYIQQISGSHGVIFFSFCLEFSRHQPVNGETNFTFSCPI